MNNIVLVHGGFVDGAGWEGVYKELKADGYNVSVVQNPTISFDGDVAATKRILEAQDGPAILVGHSYGGAVITEVGNDPKVAGLVYITAFAPDKGESVATLIKDPPPGAPVPPRSRRHFLFGHIFATAKHCLTNFLRLIFLIVIGGRRKASAYQRM